LFAADEFGFEPGNNLRNACFCRIPGYFPGFWRVILQLVLFVFNNFRGSFAQFFYFGIENGEQAANNVRFAVRGCLLVLPTRLGLVNMRFSKNGRPEPFAGTVCCFMATVYTGGEMSQVVFCPDVAYSAVISQKKYFVVRCDGGAEARRH